MASGLVLKEAIFASTHKIDAYGGFQFTEEELTTYAEKMKTGSPNPSFNHDPTDLIQMKVIDTGVRKRDDGEFEGWFTFLISEDGWQDLENRWSEAGAPGGYSITVTKLLFKISGEDSVIELSADAANWSEEDLEIAFAFQPIAGSVQVNLLYQFALVPIALVVLQVIETVSLGVVANLLTELLHRSKTKPLVASVRIKSKKHITKVVFKASSEKSINKMVSMLPDLVKGPERQVNLGNLDEQEDR